MFRHICDCVELLIMIVMITLIKVRFSSVHSKTLILFISSTPSSIFQKKKTNMRMSKRNRNHSLRTCIMCTEKFISFSKLKMHLEVDHGGEMKCSLCETIVQNKRNLVRHLQKHKGEKKSVTKVKQLEGRSSFLCDQCHYTCQYQASLKQHILRVHDQDKPFVCSFMNCNKSYSIRPDLKTHEQYSHVKLKKFQCNICVKKFVNRHKLSKHINQCHTIVGDHHCTLCQKNFRDKQALRLHIEGVHEKASLTCSQCQKGFTWQGNLARHVKDVHQKEKKHVCNFCEKSFSQNSSLKGHKQSAHAGEQIAESEKTDENFHGWNTEEVLKCQEHPQKLLEFVRAEESQLANIMLSNVNSANSFTDAEAGFELGKVFESIPAKKEKHYAQDSGSAESSHVEADPVEEMFCEANQDKQLVKTEQVDQTEQAERKLNEILLSEDGWLAEMYLSGGKSCIQSPISKISAIKSEGQKMIKSEADLAAENQVSLQDVKTEMDKEEITLKTESVMEYFQMPDKTLVSTFKPSALQDTHDGVSNDISFIHNLETETLFEPVPNVKEKTGHEQTNNFENGVTINGEDIMKREHCSLGTFCVICRKHYRSETHLKAHNRKKHDIRKWKIEPGVKSCEICRKEFDSRGHLERHRRIHFDRERFPCDQCSKTISSQENLRLHIRNTHLGLQPKKFQCPNCPLRQTSGASLKLHILRMHSIAGTFNCDMCESVFKAEDYLVAHKNRVHNGERQYKYSCTSCNKHFYEKNKYDSHQEAKHIQSGKFRCSYCLVFWGTKQLLERHLKTHLLIKDFVCTHCGKAFIQKNTLTIHMNTVHYKLKPYNCHECGKTFGQSGDMSRHIKIHHKS